MIEINVDTTEFNQKMKDLRLAIEQLHIAFGEDFVLDTISSFAQTMSALEAVDLLELEVYRLPLWFVYLILGLLLVAITFVLGV